MYEGIPDSLTEQMWLEEKLNRGDESEYDSESDDGTTGSGSKKLDTARIIAIKKVLFDINRVSTGDNKINFNQYVDMLQELSANAGDFEQLMPNSDGKQTFYDLLFSS